MKNCNFLLVFATFRQHFNIWPRLFCIGRRHDRPRKLLVYRIYKEGYPENRGKKVSAAIVCRKKRFVKKKWDLAKKKWDLFITLTLEDSKKRYWAGVYMTRVRRSDLNGSKRLEKWSSARFRKKKWGSATKKISLRKTQKTRKNTMKMKIGLNGSFRGAF